jgi:acyl-coenzyme A thioesterase PaaI-like protein
MLYGLLDAASELALLPMLDPREEALTIDMHVSLITSVPAGTRVALRAEVLHRRASVAFVRCEAQTVENGSGTVAVATVTKAISRSA